MPDAAPRTPTHHTGPIVGIDLGTTNSLIALCDERGPRILPDNLGRPLVPSIVRYTTHPTDAPIVGADAKRDAVDFPRHTITSIKRLMGRSLRDAAPDLAFLSYDAVQGERDTVRVRIPLDDGSFKLISPEEVSAEILRHLKSQAERALARPVTRAVITVPAYFDDAQRQATRTAARLAGLDPIRIVPEPTAAALAYGLGLDRAQPRNRAPMTVVVYDLGGGTFDVSVLRLTPPTPNATTTSPPDPTDPTDDTFFFRVLATAGDTHLGGDDIDHLLVELFRRDIAAQLGLNPDASLDLPPHTRRQMVALAEAVKVRLSDADTAPVRIDLGEGRVYQRTLTRDQLDALIAPLIDRTIACCDQATRDARRALGDDPSTTFTPDAVVLVGGSTRIPLVRRRVREAFGVEPYTALDPDLVVALGAAVQANALARRDATDRHPADPRPAPPAPPSLLLDVIPLSLGVETVGGAVAKIILRNSTVPARAREMFSTSVDGQTSIRLTVYQGEREMAADCRKLAEFHLRGLPPMPAGIPQVEVHFLVDANGVLSVAAHERRSGKRAQLQVIPNHGLTPDEADRIERDSFTHAREDLTRHRVVDLITNARLDLKWVGERLAKLHALLDHDYRDQLAAKLAHLRELADLADRDWTAVDPDALARAKDDLDRASITLQEVSIRESLRSD